MASYIWTYTLQCANVAEYNIWKAYMLVHPNMYPGMTTTYDDKKWKVTVVCTVSNA